MPPNKISVVYVHGTGTRDPEFSATCTVISEAVGVSGRFVPCYWGGNHGSHLLEGGASIPTYNTTRELVAAEGLLGEDDEDACMRELWTQLYRDPLYELRLLHLSGTMGAGDTPPTYDGNVAAERLKEMATGNRSELRELIVRGGVHEIFASACEMAADAAIALKIEEGGVEIALLARPLARSLAAICVWISERNQNTVRLGLDPICRDDFVEAIARELTGGTSERSIAGDLFARTVMPLLGGLAARAGTRYLKERRGASSDAAAPAAGDILLYQARGAGIRDFIRRSVTECGTDVVLLAHSLGGIAAVDALIEAAMPAVKLLVTVGTQVSFFYELNALVSLAYKKVDSRSSRLPEYFPPMWINFYDRRDFLSYLVRPLFGMQALDVEVDNKQPFPQSHSSYWYNPEVWRTLTPILNKLVE